MKAPAAVLLMLLAGLALSACASPERWENTSVARSQWAKDQAACRRQAAREAEQQYRQDQRSYGMAGPTGGRSFGAQMDRYEAQKNRRSLFNRCMKARGYVRVKSGT